MLSLTIFVCVNYIFLIIGVRNSKENWLALSNSVIDIMHSLHWTGIAELKNKAEVLTLFVLWLDFGELLMKMFYK